MAQAKLNTSHPRRLPQFARLLAILVLIHFLLIAGFSFWRIIAFKASFDLAVFDQAFWSLLHTGIPTVTTAPPFEKLNWFSWHFSPIFYLLLPWYWLMPSPYGLMLLQALCLSGAAIPLAYGLRRLALSDSLILALIGLFLFNPFYFNAGIWEFHEIAFACLFMSIALWALLSHHRIGFLLSLFALLLTKEHLGLSVACLGLLWGWRYKEWRFASLVALVGIIALLVIFLYIVPALNHGLPHPMLRASIADVSTQRYSWLQSGVQGAVQKILALLFSSEAAGVPGWLYLFLLLCTTVFLPLLAPLYILAASSDIIAVLLSVNPMPRMMTAYHSASIIPVLIVAAGLGAVTLKAQLKGRSLWGFIAILYIFIFAFSFPLSALNAFELAYAPELVDGRRVKEIQALAKDMPMAAQSNIGYLFSGREEIYPFPLKLEHAQIIVLHLSHPFTKFAYNPYSTVYALPTHDYYTRIDELLKTPKPWGIVYWRDNWLVLQRGATDLPNHVRSKAKARVTQLLASDKS